MRNDSIQLNGSSFDILKSLSDAAKESSIEWFICGATARVYLCEELFGMSPGRATMDMDIGVCVSSLEEYTSLRDRLCDGYDFEPCTGALRLKHQSGYRIDIIPFGTFTGQDKIYVWGENGRFRISVLGFEEAFRSARVLDINGVLKVCIASYAEQFGLKVIVWADRHYAYSESEDARDLAYFLRNAEKWFGLEYIHDEFPDMLLECGYDTDLVAAFALGIDLAETFDQPTLVSIASILERSLSDPQSALIRDISREFHCSDPEDRTIELLRLVLQGLRR